jgi:hypothetical protein
VYTRLSPFFVQFIRLRVLGFSLIIGRAPLLTAQPKQ